MKRELSQEEFGHLFGGYWRYNFSDFLFLMNPFFHSDRLLEDIKKDLSDLISCYPSDQKTLKKYLANWKTNFSLDAEKYCIGNGSSELIRLINRFMVQKVTVVTPTFNEYLDVEPEKLNLYQLKAENDFDIQVDELIHTVKESQSNVLALVNPNNPTGRILTREQMKSILSSLSHLDAVVIDESFIDFAGSEKFSVESFVKDFPQLIVIRSIGKEYGVPGLRLGYASTTNEAFHQSAKLYLPIWNVNSLAEWFLENFPKYKDEYEDSLRKLRLEQKKLFAELQTLPFLETIPSYSNFFLCHVKGDSSELTKQLFEKHKILIKDLKNKMKENYVRIAVGSSEENKKLISALESLSI